jgi:hypothetical protein
MFFVLRTRSLLFSDGLSRSRTPTQSSLCGLGSEMALHAVASAMMQCAA